MTFGEKIKFLRKQLNITQTEFADKLYVTRQAVQKWEVDLSSPDISKLKEISTIFGVSIDVLLDDNINELDLIKLITKEEKSKEEKQEVTPKEVIKTQRSAIDYLVLIPTWLGLFILIGMGYMFGAMLVGMLYTISLAGPIYGIYSLINTFFLTDTNQILISTSMFFIGLGIGYPTMLLSNMWLVKFKNLIKWLNNKTKELMKGIKSCVKN